MSHTFFVKFRVFKIEFLRNHLVHRIQIFRDNWNCYALSIFRGFILLALSDNDEHMLMRQRFAYWVKRANNGASAMEEANCAEDWGGPTILSPLSFYGSLRSAYYWPFFPFKKPCPRSTVIKNGQDLIDKKQAPYFCLDSCLALVLPRFCFASWPWVVCSNIRHLEARGGGGVLPYMGYIGMCRREGYGFQAVYSRIGCINQSVWV